MREYEGGNTNHDLDYMHLNIDEMLLRSQVITEAGDCNLEHINELTR
jgi:hypothetical protein